MLKQRERAAQRSRLTARRFSALTHSLRSRAIALGLCYASILPNSGWCLRLDRCTSLSACLRARCRDERGFALVPVLWIAGLLAVFIAGFSFSTRTQVRIAVNLTESAKAEALADGGVTLAVMDLLAAHRSRAHARRFPVEGRAVACAIADEGVLVISVSDEAGRIDVNTAGIPLLQALLSGLGEPPEKAARIAEAIFDFKDADEDRKPSGAEKAEYRAAGLGWAPKNAPLQSLAELEQVYGLTPDLLARMRPFLSTHSGLPGLDVAIASPELIALLRTGLEGAQSSYGSFPELHETIALPAMFVSVSQKNTFALRVMARTLGGATFVREVIVSLGPRQAPYETFLRWGRGTSVQPAEDKLTSRTQMPAC